jgi:hypothetical protein
MLRRLFTALCIIVVANAIAQDKGGKQVRESAPAIDYKQMGAPMPPFLLIAFHDTSSKIKNDTSVMRHLSKKKRRHLAREIAAHKSLQTLTVDDLHCKGNLFIMIFNPTCGHCEDQATVLEQNLGLFQKSKLVLMANRTMTDYVPGFLALHHMDRYPTSFVGTDSLGFVDNTFLYQALPQINIYNSDRRLIKTFSGEVPIDTLKKYIQ